MFFCCHCFRCLCCCLWVTMLMMVLLLLLLLLLLSSVASTASAAAAAVPASIRHEGNIRNRCAGQGHPCAGILSPADLYLHRHLAAQQPGRYHGAPSGGKPGANQPLQCPPMVPVLLLLLLLLMLSLMSIQPLPCRSMLPALLVVPQAPDASCLQYRTPTEKA